MHSALSGREFRTSSVAVSRPNAPCFAAVTSGSEGNKGVPSPWKSWTTHEGKLSATMTRINAVRKQVPCASSLVSPEVVPVAGTAARPTGHSKQADVGRTVHNTVILPSAISTTPEAAQLLSAVSRPKAEGRGSRASGGTVHECRATMASSKGPSTRETGRDTRPRACVALVSDRLFA